MNPGTPMIGKIFPSGRLHLFQHVSEPMALEPEKRNKQHGVFVLWFTQHPESRQGMNAMDRLAKVEYFGFSGSWTEGVTAGLHIDTIYSDRSRQTRPKERSPDVVRQASDVEVNFFGFDFQKESLQLFTAAQGYCPRSTMRFNTAAREIRASRAVDGREAYEIHVGGGLFPPYGVDTSLLH